MPRPRNQARSINDGTRHDEKSPALTRTQLREIDRRVRDLDDRTRYLLASALTARQALYYNVSEDTFGMGDPSFGTVFKRRSAAEAIQALLRSRVQVVSCRVSSRGRLVLKSVPCLRPHWRPQSRKHAARASRHA